MDDEKPDRIADIRAADRGEQIALMEPLMVADDAPQRALLTDLAIDLAARSAGLRRSLPDGVTTALADLVRAMNCYYSNLIEGHDTHPVDIERALKNDYSKDPQKRNLQLEARAHIAVQQWIDRGGLDGRATTAEGICEVHRRFGELLPPELLAVQNPDSGEIITMTPGVLRARDVAVGQHFAISPGAVPRFLERFEQAYSKGGKTAAILASAAAHHRLLWIHPFLDGNGRVARLMSYAMLREALDTGGIWSIARGLARRADDYKQGLAACDQPRRGDLDGRGNLSQQMLASFTQFFLETCIDQVRFMEELVQPDRLRTRVMIWTEEEVRGGRLPAKSGQVLEAVLYRGELPRGDVPALLGMTDRNARRITSALLEREVLTSESPRAPLRLAFPAVLAARWMPGLFPEQPRP
jgi:Fic family protein